MSLWTWLRQGGCVHDWHIKSSPVRIYQQCVLCEKQRPGWTLDPAKTKQLTEDRGTVTQDRVLDFRKRWRA